jgi:high-affinity Fe2+/Pb2+ permease
MRNESPVGLATVLGLLPAAAAAVVFVVLLVLNGGDIEKATAATMAIIAAVSLVGTAALRQWRAVAAARSGTAPVPLPPGGTPEPEGAGQVLPPTH